MKIKLTVDSVRSKVEQAASMAVMNGFRPFAYAACLGLIVLWLLSLCVIVVALKMPDQFLIPNGFLTSSWMGLLGICMAGPLVIGCSLVVHQKVKGEVTSPIEQRIGLLATAAIVCSAAGWILSLTKDKLQSMTELHFVVSDSEVSWCGDVPVGAVDRLAAALASADGGDIHPPRRLTMVENGGGEVIEVRKFLDRRESLGITEVSVVGRCLSACAFIWAGSPDASIERQSALGFHAAFDYVTGAKSTAPVELKIIDEILSLDRGFDEEMLQGWMQYSRNEMAMLGVGDLQALGIRHEVVERGPSIDDRCGAPAGSG
ncbi:hypothetical protein JN531_017265 (plasmid) [Flagellatimonas centrodinii]|uniref:hypothetical protein n=1 Tax=Flagellatimonas centrodinii TaxID=2806210 RepID=UPI001FED3E3F|nr:hypothetical protein [Flagellatimonas centrodinii]ULQ48383.1 hypothetical protein JN531_017265 [Flagellatimonas centrodinii]